MRSVVAHEHAQAKAQLRDKRRRAREAHRRLYPPWPSFEQWLLEQDAPDLAHRWRYQAQPIAVLEGEGESRAVTRDIHGYEAQVDGERVLYRRSGAPRARIAFADVGRRVSIYDWRSEESTLAALQLSAQKWGEFVVTGSDEFKERCVRLAARHGFRITNPELQHRIATERARLRPEQEAAEPAGAAQTKSADETQVRPLLDVPVGWDELPIAAAVRETGIEWLSGRLRPINVMGTEPLSGEDTVEFWLLTIANRLSSKESADEDAIKDHVSPLRSPLAARLAAQFMLNVVTDIGRRHYRERFGQPPRIPLSSTNSERQRAERNERCRQALVAWEAAVPATLERVWRLIGPLETRFRSELQRSQRLEDERPPTGDEFRAAQLAATRDEQVILDVARASGPDAERRTSQPPAPQRPRRCDDGGGHDW